MIKRDYYLNRLIHNMWNGEIKVITGIRRCGKSVLLFVEKEWLCLFLAEENQFHMIAAAVTFKRNLL